MQNQGKIRAQYKHAEVAELADALRSGRSGHTLVRVQIPPSAHTSIARNEPHTIDMGFYILMGGAQVHPFPLARKCSLR